ncbi:histidine phosphatase family protein [Marinobacter sp. F3R08]|uniref:histidine phosphatase family protein n=1 Tax=Marinobacter sp. F3R08 TaxID=2841559 RepID=UPI001C090A18|nr:histidine phosphatase family protein [Marinobacter sp. F3R08]MBU2952913.1 histidine phosphatase family protein [Marinobacter sp. F3R08]
MTVLVKPETPKRRRLYLIRHGDVRYFDNAGKPVDPRSVSLSPEGREQVTALREVFSGIQVDRAVSSDYPRACETLSLVLSQPPRCGKSESVDALREVRSGRLRNIPHDAYEQEVADAYRWALSPDSEFLRGESWEFFGERIIGWFQAFLGESDWHDAVIVSHDAVNRILMSWLLNGDKTLLPSLEQDPACLNIVDLDYRDDGTVGAAYLRLLNFTAYNPVKVGDRVTVMEGIACSMAAMQKKNVD